MIIKIVKILIIKNISNDSDSDSNDYELVEPLLSGYPQGTGNWLLDGGWPLYSCRKLA